MDTRESAGLIEPEMSGQIEAVAMSKVVDLASTPFVTHGTTYENLPKILREGVISGDFARRIGKKDYDSQWGSAHNAKFVSTAEGFITWGDEVEVVIRKGPNFVLGPDLSPSTREILVRNRIAPREFLGLAVSIPERRRPGYEERIEKSIEVAAIGVWRDRPQDAVPVYNLLNKSLVWPKKMTHEEILQQIEQNKQ